MDAVIFLYYFKMEFPTNVKKEVGDIAGGFHDQRIEWIYWFLQKEFL